jgi:ABC-type uncharacterized transport system substrate-binding protein
MSLPRPVPAIALAGALTLVLLAPGGSATAHPHVWITGVTTFVFEGRELVALRHRWQFDEFFSSFVIEEHDANGDGSFDAAETASVQEGAFANLEDYDYLTNARIGGDPQRLTEVQDFRAIVEDGVLIYEFTLPLPEPIDPARVSFAAGIYDPEYYVEVLLDENDPVRFAGLPPGACTFDIREDADHPIYFGMVHPLAITLSCATS